MNILMLGDVVGKAGRKAVLAHIDALIRDYALDFVVVNGENTAHGFGVTAAIADEMFAAGVDVITTGNHVWDQREIMNQIDARPNLLRPMNYPEGTPGAGAGVFKSRSGKRVMVAHPMGRLFMDPLDDPFKSVDDALANHRLGPGGTADVILVEIHAEATSEKMAMGHHLDGRVSAVVGTHSHVPTADAQVLPGGTAYQTDLGMCGDYDSVIGMQKSAAVARFTTKMPQSRLEPAEGEATICGVVIRTDDKTGRAASVRPLRLGGRLSPASPD
ncbi:MAG: TIGR00282 family metallophosphoesterase [Rhodospirillales bacterium]